VNDTTADSASKFCLYISSTVGVRSCSYAKECESQQKAAKYVEGQQFIHNLNGNGSKIAKIIKKDDITQHHVHI